jgi:hypothetical protein
MASLAQEALDGAAIIVGEHPGTRYAIACGDRKRAVAEAAAAFEAELVVVPWEPTRGVRRRFSAGVAQYLSRDGRWEVVVAPVGAPDDREAAAELDVVVTDGRDGLQLIALISMRVKGSMRGLLGARFVSLLPACACP